MINFRERMEHYRITGLSMVAFEKGKISKEDHFGVLEAGTDKKINEDTIFNACSISKFLTSILVMKLVAQGIVDLDEDVNKKLVSWKVPDNQLTKHKKVTLRNLLSHQSGIVDPEDSFMELESFNEIPSMVDILNGTTPYCPATIEVTYEPESEFHYSDAGFCLVQLLLEDITQKPFSHLIDNFIFKPLRMTSSTFSTSLSTSNLDNFACGHDQNGALIPGKYSIYPYLAACGIWTTPSDLTKLLLDVMNAVKGQSKIGITSKQTKELFRQQGCKEWTGLGVFLDGTDEKLEFSSLGWGVGFQCMLVAYPYLEQGIVLMTNTDTGMHQMKGIMGEIYHSLY
ncbi:beta-lactamase family protein [Lysinibacillus agricola]|uniref:Beta-lactamase family protein n=1 Tax=Lysinibacillus agricola TaxID=2590012 RepID=A0ABX7AKX0_9BACI|nr:MULTISPECIES: serine hydrolase domain-containing protein [Lysinibacillus]KOS64682.1 penicillin-binding protein [Lysinibacillus sp. FJAT-14222]QQP10482.1 beta-lactamase family protein [Lysinibacillus agricola]